METGLLAAEALIGPLTQGAAATAGMLPHGAEHDASHNASHNAKHDAKHDATSDTALRAGYEAALRALKPRFDLYQRASRVNDHPWLIDLLIWRAQRSARVLRGMSRVLDETGNPGSLVSLRGLSRLLLPGR